MSIKPLSNTSRVVRVFYSDLYFSLKNRLSDLPIDINAKNTLAFGFETTISETRPEH
jgi:hypothetical protein